MMDLNNLTVNVRPLSSSQAIDLGMMIARQWFLPLWWLWIKGFFLTFFSMFILIWITTFIYYQDVNMDFLTVWHTSFVLCFLIVFWCKPCIEMPLLWFIGKKLFDHQYDMQQYQREQTPISVKMVLALLLRHRLSLRRQMLMPIMILEQPATAKQRKQRLKTLAYRQNSAIVFHTMTFNLIEIGCYLGLLILVIFLLPDNLVYTNPSSSLINFFEGIFVKNNVAVYLSLLVIMMLVSSVLAPFYIAGGFAMYVCKRSQLEGWDIELKFRKLANRYQKEKQKFDIQHQQNNNHHPKMSNDG